MHPNTKTLRALATAVAVAALLVGPAAGAHEIVANPAEAPIQPDALKTTLEGLGYSNVHDVEWDDGFWEVEAISPQGKPVDLMVDPQTGAVVHEEID